MKKNKYKYAIVDSNKNIINIIESDNINSDVILKLFIKDCEVILINDKTGKAYIGGKLVDKKFLPPSPFGSWNLEKKEWKPPIEYPQDGNLYIWNENSLNWQLVA